MRACRRRLASLAPLLLVAAGLGSALPAAVRAQAGEEGDRLIASLLQTEDLPAGFSTIGPEEGSDFDIDSGAFSQAGGRRVVSQAWSSETSGVVFDFRMELPSSEAAARYLDEAEVTLSEADITGLSLERDDPPVGDDARHYTGVTRVGDAAITFDNYLFHVGPVAAKVFVAAVDLPEGEARHLAEVAAERMAPFGVIDPSMLDRTPSPTDHLLALVPASVAASCEPFTSGTDGEVAALTCDRRGDLIVYSAFAAPDALRDAFESLTAEMPTDDLGASCATGPFSGPYDAGVANGTVACWDPPSDGLVLFWTDDARLVLGGILADTDDEADLDAAWEAALLP